VVKACSQSRFRQRRHGLTLLEVLLATALLAILASTGVSLLRSVRQSRAGTAFNGVSGTQMNLGGSPLCDQIALEQFAEAFLSNPEAFGVKTLEQVIAGGNPVTIPWPDQPNWPDVQVRWLRMDTAEKMPRVEQLSDRPTWILNTENQVWVEFTCEVTRNSASSGAAKCYRWILLADGPDEGE
jgi:prepilin-type N-terminal cleavage/methylation domain-containing protein